ncbi:hypothetical protein EDL81_02625 [Ehrlichia ruminantium]|uniref:hypothetical protein n=1 Tax=Ehrlichia ruminantium TaxID=779 RepID=UPI00130E1FF5|nr:hypothetical protein [Ehrlichia ruminantium]QGR02533.1 hypothetical protein EDL81_02625 [Ehrlichia ruminantium]
MHFIEYASTEGLILMWSILSILILCAILHFIQVCINVSQQQASHVDSQAQLRMEHKLLKYIEHCSNGIYTLSKALLTNTGTKPEPGLAQRNMSTSTDDLKYYVQLQNSGHNLSNTKVSNCSVQMQHETQQNINC